jgi:hypothetical protein
MTPTFQGEMSDQEAKATMSLCCGFARPGCHPPGVMHSGLCREIHGGELGPTYYLIDSGLTMDDSGAMRVRSE